jgi:adenylosuccinate lyase
MLENLGATKGLIFSGQLLLALTNKGLSREHAYELVQRNAMRVWDENRDFRELVKADTDIQQNLSEVEIDRVFSLDHYLRNIDAIYKRVGIL